MRGARAIAAALTTSSLVAWSLTGWGPAGSARAEDRPLVIGVLNDRTGTYADTAGAGSALAARLAIEDVGGTVLGQPVQLLAADHQNKADVGAAIAREWLDRRGVDAIVDVPNSAVMLAVQEIVRSKRGLVLAVGGLSSQFNQAACSPYGFQWLEDTYALANGTVEALAASGVRTWFLVQVDYAFGEIYTADLRRFIEARGGKVVGVAKHPLNTADFSSFIVQAQASRADLVMFINAGADTLNALKQAADFGVAAGGQRLATALLFVNEVRSLGVEAARGLTVLDGYYWALSPETRAFGERFAARNEGRKPSSIQIGVYSAVSHYLKVVAAAGSFDRDATAAKMRAMPVNDAFVKGGRVREDGLLEHDLYLLRVKRPADVHDPWDPLDVVSTIPGRMAFRPAAESACPLVGK